MSPISQCEGYFWLNSWCSLLHLHMNPFQLPIMKDALERNGSPELLSWGWQCSVLEPGKLYPSMSPKPRRKWLIHNRAGWQHWGFPIFFLFFSYFLFFHKIFKYSLKTQKKNYQSFLGEICAAWNWNQFGVVLHGFRKQNKTKQNIHQLWKSTERSKHCPASSEGSFGEYVKM